MKFLTFLLFLTYSLHALDVNELALKGVASETISLQQAFTIGQARNLSLQQKRTSINVAESEYQRSWSEILPKLVVGSSTHTDILARNAPEFHKASVKLSTALFDFSSMARIKSSKQALLASKATYEHENNQLLYDIAKSYIEVLMAQSLKQIAEEEFAQSKKQLEVFQKKVVLGLARPLDETRGLYLVNKAESDLALKERDMKRSLAYLGKLLNRTDAFFVSHVAIESPYFSEHPEVLAALAQNASDIRALQNSFSQEEHALSEAKLKLLPKIQAHIETGVKLPYSLTTSQTSPFSELIFSIEIPLSLASLSHVKKQQAQFTSAEIALRELQRDKDLNVYGVLEQIATYQIALKSAEQALIAAQKAASSAERLYAAGEANALELVEAQVNLRNSQSQAVNAELRLLQNKLHLLFLIGKISEVK